MTGFIITFFKLVEQGVGVIDKSPFLKENFPVVVKVVVAECTNAVSSGVKKMASTLKLRAIQETTYAEEVAIHLIKLTTKVVIRESAVFCTKAIMKYFGVERVALEGSGFKTILIEHSYQAGLLADLIQSGLEVAGYRQVGKQVGNIVTGAVTGYLLTGPNCIVRIFIGALVGFILWIIGQLTGQIINDILS